MATETLAEVENGTVLWDDEIEAVVTKWHDYVAGDRFRDGMLTALECIRERGARKSMGDSRPMKALPQEDQRWVGEEWTPAAIEAGVERSAVVYADSAIARMGLERFAEEMEEIPMDMMVTADVEEAREFLRG